MSENSGGEDSDSENLYSISQNQNIEGLKLKLEKKRQKLGIYGTSEKQECYQGIDKVQADRKEGTDKVIVHSNVVIKPAGKTESVSKIQGVDVESYNMEVESLALGEKGLKRGASAESIVDQRFKKSNTRNDYLINNRYCQDDSGPFVVFVEGGNNDASAGKIHPMKLGRFLFCNENFPTLHKDIDSINRGGKNRIKVIFKNYATANMLVSSNMLNHLNLIAYIPNYAIYRQGVIKNVDVDLDESSILEAIDSSIKVHKVTRIKKLIEKTLVNTGTAIITFRGQHIPSSLKIFGYPCRVEPYFQRTVQCFRCWRFGHVGRQCNGQIRCCKCSGTHTLDSCKTLDALCANCNGKHFNNDKNCPKYQDEVNIKKVMAIQNISYNEAKKLNAGNNTYADMVKYPINISDQRTFPSLGSNINKFSVFNTLPENFSFVQKSTVPKQSARPNVHQCNMNSNGNRQNNTYSARAAQQSNDFQKFPEKYRVSNRPLSGPSRPIYDISKPSSSPKPIVPASAENQNVDVEMNNNLIEVVTKICLDVTNGILEGQLLTDNLAEIMRKNVIGALAKSSLGSSSSNNG